MNGYFLLTMVKVSLKDEFFIALKGEVGFAVLQPAQLMFKTRSLGICLILVHDMLLEGVAFSSEKRVVC